MMRAILSLLALALGGLPALAWPGPSPQDELRALAAAHPDDPDLAWAYIIDLEGRAERERAVEQLQRYVSRWPKRRHDAWQRLGRLLYERGSYAPALAALDGAAALRIDGTTHFYRGLCLRELGRPREAEGALLVAARLEPDLAAEARLAAALAALDRGEQPRARVLLRQVLEQAPATEAGRQAALLVGRPRAVRKPRRRLGLFASTGIEADSNVLLKGDLSPAGVPSDEADLRAVGNVGFSYRFFENERASATVGYRYAESKHMDLDPYDLRNHMAFVGGEWKAGAGVTVRLDGFASDQHLDGEPYLSTWAARPSLLLSPGAGMRLTRLFAEIEHSRYHDDVLLDSLVRNGFEFALAAEHYVPLGFRPNTWGSAGLRLSHVKTDADRDLLGFESAYDRQGARATLRMVTPLPWRIEADVAAAYSYDRYLHTNVIDGLFESGVTGADRRRDHVIEGTVALSRPLSQYTSLELRWHGTMQRSNVDTYSYRRNIVGLYVRAQVF